LELDAKSVEFDFVLPIVTGWHRLGALGLAGLDELEEHDSLVTSRECHATWLEER